MLTQHRFDTRDAASAAAAARIAGLVNAQLLRDERAHFVVGGGTTPAACFGYLSGYELEWDKVQVALSDERWVPNDHPDSNELLIRESLLTSEASSARVLPLYQDDLSVDERCDALESERPENGFACSMVGMGTDGHFASLFPDAECLEAGLSLNNSLYYMPVRTTASPHPRISMTLAAILDSDEVIVLFFGEEKLAVFENAHTVDKNYPVTALIEQDQTPVSLYWAP